MKKGTKIFIPILFIEIALSLIVSLFMKGICNYSTPCSVPSFFNPLGIQFGACIQVIVSAPCNLSLIYSLNWLIIFTVLAYLIYLWIGKNRR